mmetsp:Transcript_18779/g.28911  ORF Transcript_18779/g.28911 Transcript_18779/m.28911 type:complete len:136 (-) Transcript_18779:1136-1543(-)
MMVLGRLYEHGIHYDQDLDKALAFYDLATKHHEPYAYYKLGVFLESGIHPDCSDGPNKELAFKYFKEAQNKGEGDIITDKEATFKIGQYFEGGLGGVEKNLNQAKRHYEWAATDGHIESMNALGRLFFEDLKEYE